MKSSENEGGGTNVDQSLFAESTALLVNSEKLSRLMKHLERVYEKEEVKANLGKLKY